MSERSIQFQVGLFVLAAFAVGTVLIVQFGDLKRYWRETYVIAVHFKEATGVHKGTPVRQYGINIGDVREVRIDDEQGGVLVVLELDATRHLWQNAKCALAVSLFGDAVIEFSGAPGEKRLAPRSQIEGMAAVNPLEIVQRMENNLAETLVTFKSTGHEWQEVGRNLNRLMETKQGNLDEVVERAALALNEFTKTMRSADAALASARSVIGDPQVQANLKRTVAALPEMVEDTRRTIEETRKTITAARSSVTKINDSLDSLKLATDPIAHRSEAMTAQLEHSLRQFDSLLTELNVFGRAVNDSDGALHRFVADPALYDNMSRSAAALSVMLENLKPVVKDLRVFSDRVARHPEVLGIYGAFHASSGVKDPPAIEQTGHTGPRPFNSAARPEKSSQK